MEEKTKNIYTKLLDFQKLEITVAKVGDNPYFATKDKAGNILKMAKYVTLNEVLDKVKKPLNDMGIVIIFAPEADGLRTTLYDTESNTKIEGFMKYVGADNAQKLLSCNTYFRRGSLVSLLGLEDEDDDGNKASEPTVQYAPKAPKPSVGAYQTANDMITACSTKEELEELMTKITNGKKFNEEQMLGLGEIAEATLFKILGN